MKDYIENIYSILLGRYYQETLFGNLDKFARSGRSYSACCPFHDDKNPSLLIYGDKPGYFCYSCGASGDWIKYIEHTKNYNFKEALNHLANEAGIDHSIFISEYNTIEINQESVQKEEKHKILNIAQLFFKKCFKETDKDDVYSYLYNERKYSPKNIKDMDIGAIYDLKLLRNELFSHGFSAEAISAAGLSSKWIGSKESKYNLVIPYRDEIGQIQGFIFRSILSPSKLHELKLSKYKYSYGLKRESLFNHHLINDTTVTIVEGILDSLILKVNGLNNVVAVGSASIVQNHIDKLKKDNVRNVNLCFDNDDAGKNGTYNAINLCITNDIEPKLIIPSKDYKDPDECISKFGFPAFLYDFNNAKNWINYIVNRKLSKVDRSNNSELYDVVKEIYDIALGSKNPLIHEAITKEISDYLDITRDVLESIYLSKLKEISKERKEKYYNNFLNEIKSLYKLGDFEEIDNQIKSFSLTSPFNLNCFKYDNYSIDTFINELKNTPPGLKTGLEDLDNIISIPTEAITIIAGRPSHGKTTFLLNLLVNFVKNDEYSDKTFLFFSYEETRKQISLKITNILGETELSSHDNLNKISDYIKTSSKNNNNINKAIQYLNTILSNKKAIIIDEPFQIDDLVNIIQEFNNKYNVGAVLIDYITKIRITGNFGTRQLEVQKISEKLLDCAKFTKLPIIIGAQLGRDKDRENKVRLDNLREAGDIEQDANLVLGLNNRSMGVQNTENAEVDLEISILKNRNGIVNQDLKFAFNRPILKISTLNNNNSGW